MTTAAVVLLVVAVGFAIADWVAVATARERTRYVTKPATLAALIAVALALDPTHADVRAWFVVALVCSLAGDVFLMLPSDRFVTGLAAFLLGHLAYVVGLSRHGGSAAALALSAIPVAVVAGGLAVRFARALRAGGEGGLLGPVVAYMVAISAMVVSALATGNVWAAVGAVLFMASDSLIAENRFVAPRTWAPLAIMVTYHLGQAGLVVSLTR